MIRSFALSSAALSIVLSGAAVAQNPLPAGDGNMTAPATTPVGPSNLGTGSSAQSRRAQAAAAGVAAAPGLPTADRMLLYPSPISYRLSVGDVIGVTIFGNEYAAAGRIDEQGNIRLPLLGTVSLAHKSIAEAQQYLAAQFVAAGIFRDPEVSISLTESPNAYATLLGEVRGSIPVISERRLIDVISDAGGFPVTASHVVTIVREGEATPITLDLGRDPYTSPAASTMVRPGDRIYIGKAGVVYMVGAFRQQGMLALSGNNQLTLMEAAALSGGPDNTAKRSDLRLIRMENGKRVLVALDLKKVLYGKAPDPLLQPDDIVFLPSSALREAVGNGTLSTLTSAASLALSAIAITR